MTVNVHEAKTSLSRLLTLVESGEEVVIARAGKPVARLVAEHPVRPAPRLGTMAAVVELLPGWDAPLADEELAMFEPRLTDPETR